LIVSSNSLDPSPGKDKVVASATDADADLAPPGLISSPCPGSSRMRPGLLPRLFGGGGERLLSPTLMRALDRRRNSPRAAPCDKSEASDPTWVKQVHSNAGDKIT